LAVVAKLQESVILTQRACQNYYPVFEHFFLKDLIWLSSHYLFYYVVSWPRGSKEIFCLWVKLTWDYYCWLLF